jgi:carbon storage regulator CsrA
MRIFFQGKNESIVVNDDITVTVLDIDGDEVVLGIDTPEWMEIGGNEPSHSENELEEWSPLRPR